ncbi:MAG: serine hydrolase [Candidatus Eremiobacteraeota bacterium]|nr:serine hydrolase [Candidatus Eremiobacteraeota bacterium]
MSILLSLLCVTAVAAGAAPPDFQATLDEQTKAAPGTGYVVGVMDSGGVSYFHSGASGNERLLDEHTVFEIGSVTKTFTATILASMVLDHSVSLNDPVSKFLPSSVRVPSRNGKQITLLNLATQQSGLPRLPTNMDETNTVDPYASYTVKKMYAFLNSYRLPRDPGTACEYSNVGIGLLGVALANRAHTSYWQLLRRRVLEPLGMHDTALSSSMTSGMNARMAVGHDADGNAVKPWNADAIAPAGGLRSTAADMLRFVRCAMGRGPLAKACVFAQQPRAPVPAGRIGLVWMQGDIQHLIWHNGETGGFTSAVAVSQDHAKGVIVLSNGIGNADALAFHMLDARNAVPMPQASLQLDAAAVDEYTGSYTAAAEHLTFTLTHNGGALMAALTGQAALRVYASSKDHFYYRAVPATMEFTRDAHGKINALILHQNGQSLTFIRAGMTAPAPQASGSAATVSLDAATLDQYVGTYIIGPSAGFVIRRDGSALMAQLTGQPFFEIYASAKDHFFYKVVEAQLEFTRDANGRVTGLILHQNGRDIPATKQ